jgi:multidrug efflux system membrane fusion protein
VKKFTLISVTSVLVTVFLVDGCSNKKQAAPAGVPVLVAKAIATNVPVQIQPPPVGHVEAYSTVQVRSQIVGIISKVHFKEGDEVKSNALLFTIDPRPTQAVLDQARANLERDQAQLEYATVNFSREQKLFDAKIISRDELDTNKAALDAATGVVAADTAAVTNAELNLEFTEIRSPIDGKVGELQFYQGNVVKAEDDTLLTINQIHPIYVQFAVPEQYLPEIKKQMGGGKLKVSATFQNMDAPPPQGELTFVDNTVDETTGTIQLKGTFPNENSALWPGQFVQVTLTLSELTNAVVVPTQAVQTGQTNQFIYVVKPDPTNAAVQVVEERSVTIGVAYDGETVVQSGLKAGETVVTDGQLRLAPGVTVSVKNQSEPAPAPTKAP